MTKWMTWALVLATSTLVTGCRKEFRGSGNYTTETRVVANFNQITSSGDFEVILITDPVSRVILHGEDNILPEVITEVLGNELKIYYDHHHYNYDHNGITITVYSPDFKKIELEGSGKITCADTLHSNLDINLSGSGKMELTVNSVFAKTTISGSGNVTLYGASQTANHTISGSGKLNAFILVCNNVNATISGSGTCKVYAISYLDATISGSGEIIYLGNPQITTHISGSGKVKPG